MGTRDALWVLQGATEMLSIPANAFARLEFSMALTKKPYHNDHLTTSFQIIERTVLQTMGEKN